MPVELGESTGPAASSAVMGRADDLTVHAEALVANQLLQDALVAAARARVTARQLHTLDRLIENYSNWVLVAELGKQRGDTIQSGWCNVAIELPIVNTSVLKGDLTSL